MEKVSQKRINQLLQRFEYTGDGVVSTTFINPFLFLFKNFLLSIINTQYCISFRHIMDQQFATSYSLHYDNYPLNLLYFNYPPMPSLATTSSLNFRILALLALFLKDLCISEVIWYLSLSD